jgi:hypothetical protein
MAAPITATLLESSYLPTGQTRRQQPLQLAGVQNVPSFAEILDQLLNPNIAAQPI